MSETVYRIRYATPGFDDNGDPTPGGQTRTPLQARAIAPGASRRNVTVGRNGESTEHTVYFRPAVDLTNDDEIEIRGELYKVRTALWCSAYGTGRSGLEVFAVLDRG